MAAPLDSHVQAIRHFNRVYTRRIGVLREGLLHSRFSLTEVRVLYELAHRQQPTAADLARELDLDAGYLSRILRAFQRRGWIARSPAPQDARRSLIRLTARGRKAFAPLDARAHEEMAQLVAALPAGAPERLVAAMREIEMWIAPPAAPAPRAVGWLLRPPRAGDFGWMVQRHGELYAQEYGWDERFEGLVAEIVGRFVRGYDAQRERCWMAEREGHNIGSVLLVSRAKTVAQLRLLLVDPAARGTGVGTRLVDECIRFARQVGYRRIMLWTNDVLQDARRIYERAGFQRVRAERHSSFGQDLVGETWQLTL
jgi:DNA-binding MarR family transcriptional regulator/GNAT superfamily N-acetyltransferase